MVRMLKKSLLSLVALFVTTLVLGSCSQIATLTQSDDATLDPSKCFIKGESLTATELGSGTLNTIPTAGTDSDEDGFKTLTTAHASATTTLETTFVPTSDKASVVKVILLSHTEKDELVAINGFNSITIAQFEAHAGYRDEAIENKSAFVIKVQAQDGTVRYYAMNINVNESGDDPVVIDEVASVISDLGGQTTGAMYMALSADGTYAVFSDNITVYRKDLITDTIWSNPVSVPSDWDGEAPITSPEGEELKSYNPAISANGRYIAFESNATNLNEKETNDLFNIFLKDMDTGAVTLISEGFELKATEPSISEDGSVIAFTSSDQIYVYKGTIPATAVSSPVNASSSPAVSGDGRYVVYYDSTSDSINRVKVSDFSVEVLVTAADGHHRLSSPSVNYDGTKVVYRDNIEETSIMFIYLYDVNEAQSFPIRDRDGAVAASSTLTDNPSARISSDGTKVCFSMTGVSLDPYIDDNGRSNVYVADVSNLGAITTVMASSRSNIEGPAAGDSDGCTISGDGRFVGFWSNSGFVDIDAGTYGGFVRDMENGERDAFIGVTLAGEGITFGEDLILTTSITDGTPFYTCAWEYQIVGMHPTFVPYPSASKTDCRDLTITSNNIPMPLTVKFRVTATDGLGVSQLSDEITVVVSPAD